MATIKEIADRFNKMVADGYGDDHVAVDIWYAIDILDCAHEQGVDLTPEKADEIIDEIHRKRDASVGINYEVVVTHLGI